MFWRAAAWTAPGAPTKIPRVDEPPDRELFRRQARQYGFDEKEYLEALDRVPRWSREKVGSAMALTIAQGPVGTT